MADRTLADLLEEAAREGYAIRGKDLPRWLEARGVTLDPAWVDPAFEVAVLEALAHTEVEGDHIALAQVARELWRRGFRLQPEDGSTVDERPKATGDERSCLIMAALDVVDAGRTPGAPPTTTGTIAALVDAGWRPPAPAGEHAIQEAAAAIAQHLAVEDVLVLSGGGPNVMDADEVAALARELAEQAIAALVDAGWRPPAPAAEHAVAVVAQALDGTLAEAERLAMITLRDHMGALSSEERTNLLHDLAEAAVKAMPR